MPHFEQTMSAYGPQPQNPHIRRILVITRYDRHIIMWEVQVAIQTSFTEEDMIRFGHHASKVADEMKSTILNNPLDVALDSFADKLLDRMLEASQNDQAIDNIMTTDNESWRGIASLLLRHNKRVLLNKNY